jgi:hypothetical protein
MREMRAHAPKQQCSKFEIFFARRQTPEALSALVRAGAKTGSRGAAVDFINFLPQSVKLGGSRQGIERIS